MAWGLGLGGLEPPLIRFSAEEASSASSRWAPRWGPQPQSIASPRHRALKG